VVVGVTAMLGLDLSVTRGVVIRFAAVGTDMARAFAAYIDDVKAGRFPDLDHSYPSD
jgi:ketopantoate hydroxymethyltransferase